MVNKIDTKTLNEKLALWVGFKIPINRFTNKPFPHRKYSANLWETPEGMITTELPDLVGSLDAQVKWIYPKLPFEQFERHMISTKKYENTVSIVRLEDNFIPSARNENLALAFALAVEKLIDSLEKKHETI